MQDYCNQEGEVQILSDFITAKLNNLDDLTALQMIELNEYISEYIEYCNEKSAGIGFVRYINTNLKSEIGRYKALINKKQADT